MATPARIACPPRLLGGDCGEAGDDWLVVCGAAGTHSRAMASRRNPGLVRLQKVAGGTGFGAMLRPSQSRLRPPGRPTGSKMDAMDPEQPVLSLKQARRRVLAALAGRWPAVSFEIQSYATLAREFGWVFTLEVGAADPTTLVKGPPLPRLALVSRASGQAVTTSRSYSPEQFGAVFERLLARSRGEARNWCLTMNQGYFEGERLSIAQEARAAGLEQLAASLERSPT